MHLSSIFGSYDVRAVYPDTLDEQGAYAIGRALAIYLKQATIVVGRDMRTAAPAIQEALMKGLTEQGSDVVDIGLVSTDMSYFACGKYGYGGAVMVTASHNPPQYIGMKFCRENAIPMSLTTGLKDVCALAESGDFPTPPRTGMITPKDVYADWISHALSFIDTSTLKPLRIVVDAGNGMAGKVIPQVAEKIPVTIIPLYFELDGTFPNHLANPIEPENIKDLQDKVRETNADLGMAFDGDADRVFLTDETGAIIPGTLMTAMVAKMMLGKQPGETILYNAICGDICPETIVTNGGKAVRTKVGHSIIKQDMRTHNAIFAGEHSGHYYFRDNYYADSGLIAALIVLELISKDGRKLSEIVQEFDRYHASGEINSWVEDIPAKLAKIKQAFADAQLDELDGITIRYPEWWANIRASNTEPLLRLNIEAKTAEELTKQTEKLTTLIRS
ncbi:MAG TPA: phosphomannomutase/phosphoglucomutase [bacterium]|nr:phosphomannomutase/phosphoglucomutase [bacterium]